MIRDRDRRGRRPARRDRRRRRRTVDPRRRPDRGADAERPSRHRRRLVDPGHDRHRRPVFLLPPGSIRSIAASMSPAPPASITSRARPARRRRPPSPRLHGLPEQALIDMGDFVGGMLKYLRRHPVPRVTVAGGMAKMSKLGQGLLDLHSRRGDAGSELARRTRASRPAARPALAARIGQSNSAMEAFAHAKAAGVDLPAGVATAAWRTAAPGARRRHAAGNRDIRSIRAIARPLWL